MCMLTYYPANVDIDVASLRCGARKNDDGHGFAVVDIHSKEIITYHSMDAELAIATFIKVRGKHMDGPALFHSRWSTGGDVSTFNCHPFKVTDRWWSKSQQYLNHKGSPTTVDKSGKWMMPADTTSTVVAHNGILPIAVSKKDRRSDTRKAAEEILGVWYDLSIPAERTALGKWIGRGNKLVILTVDPRFGDYGFIINEEQGNWDGDIWYSNFDYIPYQDNWRTYGSYASRTGVGAASTGTKSTVGCELCGHLSTGIDPDGYCETCGTCIDCLEQVADCQCYPGRQGHANYLRERKAFWRSAETEDSPDETGLLSTEPLSDEKIEILLDIMDQLEMDDDTRATWFGKVASERHLDALITVGRHLVNTGKPIPVVRSSTH